MKISVDQNICCWGCEVRAKIFSGAEVKKGWKPLIQIKGDV